MRKRSSAADLAELARLAGVDTTDHAERVGALRDLIVRRVPRLALLRVALPELFADLENIDSALRAVQVEALVQAEREMAERMRRDALLAGRLPTA